MLELFPDPTIDHLSGCPHCGGGFEVQSAHVPGMHTLVHLECESCRRAYYGELPIGHAIHAPLVLEAETGTIHGNVDERTFGAHWLSEAYANRTDEPVGFETHQRRPVEETAVLFNCLDGVYGHALLKLLNCQYHLDAGHDHTLVVLIPRSLGWLVPDGVDGVWTVDAGLDMDTTWNERLDVELRRGVEQFETCFLDPCFPVPSRNHVDIERFTGIDPFPRSEWENRLETPTVTFIWREQSKLWSSTPRAPRKVRRVRGYLNKASEWLGFRLDRREQIRNVARLERRLRERFPDLDFAVTGIGSGGSLPDSVEDLRVDGPDQDDERALCRRYANSHVVVGVHGSNMLLPSAHAGAVVELMPFHKWGNITEDMIPRTSNREQEREALFHGRVLPIGTRGETLAEVVASTLTARKNRGWHKEQSNLGVSTWERAQAEWMGNEPRSDGAD